MKFFVSGTMILCRKVIHDKRRCDFDEKYCQCCKCLILYYTLGVVIVLNVKALAGTFNQEKALIGAFSVIAIPSRIFVSSSSTLSHRQNMISVSLSNSPNGYLNEHHFRFLGAMLCARWRFPKSLINQRLSQDEGAKWRRRIHSTDQL